jgi:integrase
MPWAELDAANVRRDFRRVLDRTPGLNSADWTPREMRHSFVSLLSESGLDIEKISLLVGHKSTQVTETVYRHQLRPVLTEGTEAMDGLLPQNR